MLFVHLLHAFLQPTPDTMPPFDLSVIIPANNEGAWIGRCLTALVTQDSALARVEVIVVANACSDDTVAIAQGHADRFAARGWTLRVLDLAQGGKLPALNAGDAAAGSPMRLYLDADITCDPPLLGQIHAALAAPDARYATGTLAIAPAQSWITRRYAAVWSRLPFVKGGAVGAGLFAVNAAGRARWPEFPAIISDDTFVRLQFRPKDRIEVPARYHWPMVEGFGNLVRVRRRQDAGVAQLHDLYPTLAANEAKARLTLPGLLGIALRDPLGFLVYTAVHIAVRLRPASGSWTRGR
jgi:glycosyltransferase involved in cell wall biosynthesis